MEACPLHQNNSHRTDVLPCVFQPNWRPNRHEWHPKCYNEFATAFCDNSYHCFHQQPANYGWICKRMVRLKFETFFSCFWFFKLFFRGNKVVATLLSVLVIGINTYFVVETVNELHLHWFALTIVVIVGIIYLLFCAYLVIHMAVSMGYTGLLQYRFVRKYVMGPVDANMSVNPITYSR